MNASAARIEGLTRELRAHWQQTRDQWQDAKSQEFEQRFLQELFSSVDKTVAVIDEIEKVVGKIRKECE